MLTLRARGSYRYSFISFRLRDARQNWLLFAHGSLYDSIYQERYMGLPDANAKGYRDGSPITFAEGLNGKLMIVQGSGDDNVHFQSTQRLLNKLISLNKQFHFIFMEYPNRRHGVQGSAPVHLDNLRYGFFEEYLAAGPR